MNNSLLVYALAIALIVFVAIGITPPAKKIGTTPHPTRLMFSLALCVFFVVVSLYLPSPFKGFVFVFFTMAGWTDITHFVLKIPYDQFSTKGALVAVLWLVVVVPILYLLDQPAAEMMWTFYKGMWNEFVRISARIIEVAAR
jgi:magnesium-transporting ATPase (P-type)